MAKEITLGGHFEEFVDGEVAAGHFNSAGEVVQAGLILLERQKNQYQRKIAVLRDAIDEGDASGVFEGDPFASVREELGLPVRR